MEEIKFTPQDENHHKQEVFALRHLSTSAVAVAADPQAFRPYTGLSALQLAGTMVVNPSRLETIKVVGAFVLNRVAREIGDEVQTPL